MKTRDSRPLADRKILITGASSGVGRHFALTLARNGAAVACCARRVPMLEALVAEIRAEGGSAQAIACDVGSAESISVAFDEAQGALGAIDSVICNAGVQTAGSALKLEVGDLDSFLSVNLRGAFLTAREGARRISTDAVAESRRRIVFISSILGLRPMAGTSAYGASKAAMNMMTRTMALEWARRGITVNAICPGFMKTEITEENLDPQTAEAQLARWPRHRFMALSQLDGPLLFLLSEAAAGTTGNALVIDEAQSLA